MPFSLENLKKAQKAVNTNATQALHGLHTNIKNTPNVKCFAFYRKNL
jgi:hypothetical protein